MTCGCRDEVIGFEPVPGKSVTAERAAAHAGTEGPDGRDG